MTLRSLAFATALALSLPLAGCMTSGVKFTMAEVEALQPGVTTKDGGDGLGAVKAALGL